MQRPGRPGRTAQCVRLLCCLPLLEAPELPVDRKARRKKSQMPAHMPTKVKASAEAASSDDQTQPAVPQVSDEAAEGTNVHPRRANKQRGVLVPRVAHDQWIGRHNPPAGKQYAKGWWDSAELVRVLCPDSRCRRVIGQFLMRTPPPAETLVMPVVALRLKGAKVVLKNNFGWWPNEWLACIQTERPLPCYGLFDPNAVVRQADWVGIPRPWRLGPHAKSPHDFSCYISDAAGLIILIWLLEHERNAVKPSLHFGSGPCVLNHAITRAALSTGGRAGSKFLSLPGVAGGNPPD